MTLDTGLTATKGTRQPSISRPSHGSGSPRSIERHFVPRCGLIGSNPRPLDGIGEPKGDDIGRLNRVLVIVYFVEVGLVLIVAPWTRFWDRNYFVESLPFLAPLLTSHVLRGAVSGLGIVSLGAAAVDVSSWLRQRWAEPHDRSAYSILTRPVDLSSQDLREEVYPPSS